MVWLIALLGLAVLASFTSGIAAAALTYAGGFVLGIAAKLMDIALYALAAKFDVIIYGSLATIVGQLWTTFRDIANIVVIGMFTFTAIAMILGLQNFNARRMVANVLLIAILINFSLLFTRIIIASTNFVSQQFYCSMMTSSGGLVCQAGTSREASLAEIMRTTNGIGLQFMEFLGAKDFTQARDTANEIYNKNVSWGTWLGGNWYGSFFALLYGATAAALMIAAAFLFAYIAFLLVARAIMLIFLLITSSLAFGSFLIPNYMFGRMGWSPWNKWWSSLLRSALFAPILVVMLWVTFKVSQGLVATVGQGRSFDALFTNQASGTGYLAILIFAMILGMLVASVRFATSFANSISGFNMAAIAPALAAGVAGRFGGFLGRQFVGRPGIAIGDRLAQAAKDSANKENQTLGTRLATSLYGGGARAFGGLGKRDFNLMRGQLGKEVAGVSKMQLDTVAGKALGGFVGVQDQYKKQAAQQAERLAYSEEERTARAKKALEKHGKSDPDYVQAEAEHEEAKKQLDKAREEAAVASGNIASKYDTKIRTAARDYEAAQTRFEAGTGTKADADAAYKTYKDHLSDQKKEMSVVNERVKSAMKHMKDARQRFEDEAEIIGQRAVAAGDLPKNFKSTGDIAKENIRGLTAMLRANNPLDTNALAEKIGKEVGKATKASETVKLFRDLASKKANEVEGKPGPAPTKSP